MRQFIDTRVWSLALRRPKKTALNTQELHLVATLQDAIQDRRAVLIGPIRQEILSGIRDAAQFASICELLDPFLDEEIRSSDYTEAARLFNLCRSHGIECGSTDILLCTVAARTHYGILTNDQGLQRCIELLKSEGELQ